jgi:beta-aspartyl-peptidase (threonine type)
MPHARLLSSSFALLLAACAGGAPPQPTAPSAAPGWAIALHGGAGTLDPTTPEAELQGYRDALRAALTIGRDRLARGDDAVDVCEAVVRVLEDDPHFNAGRGAVLNARGVHELEAAIMDGSTLAAGAVTGLRTVKNPVSLARLVMTKTRHVLLGGDGAEEFATGQAVERVPNEHFTTERRRRLLDEALRERAAASKPGGTGSGTVGCVVRDQRGKLAAATSTGGLTAKMPGRIGDTPLVGAGTYADAFAAVSGTGTGEQFMRHAVARTITARMQFGGQSLAEAAHAVVFTTLRQGDGGVIAVDRDGTIAMPFNSTGMYRGAADASGRFEVRIFAE